VNGTLPAPQDQKAYPAWTAWAVLCAAACVRLLSVGEWSLWLDEETTIYFALNPDRPFPSSFPLYFWLLGALFDMTGVSVAAARLLTASIGIWTLWLLYRTATRFCGDQVALPALVLLSLSVGHVFWSQNIRYYVLLLAFQLLSIHAFLAAVDRPQIRAWAWAAVWFGLALASHLTAALLLPVYAAFVGWLVLHRASRRTLSRALVVVAVLVGLTAILWASWFGDFARMFSGSAPRGGVYAVRHMALYAGAPAVALAFLGALFGEPRNHGFVFFLLLGSVPAIGLLVVGSLDVWWPVWYHGFVALAGIAVMGGYGWQALTRRAPRWIVLTTGLGGAAASLALLVVYHTTAFGDRPRWKEAAMVVAADAASSPGAQRRIVAHFPSVIAHYLGVPPGETMQSSVVKPWMGLDNFQETAAYVIVLESDLPPRDRSWLRESCRELIRLPSRMIIRDRTVVAFLCETGLNAN
jgi:hypothetical protein